MTTLSKNCTHGSSRNFDDIQHGLFQSMQHWFRVQQLKIEISKEREQLSMLSNASLSDLGITRAEADAESGKNDIPAFRLNEIKSKKC